MPRTAARYYVRWGDGALELAVEQERLTIVAGNGRIVLEPRAITVEARYTVKRDVEDRNRRTVFIEFAEQLAPIASPPRVDIVGRNYLGYFEVVYTDLDFERYLTIITPASFLYDYVVLTSRDLMAHMPSKRKVYFEEEPYDKVTVYIV